MRMSAVDSRPVRPRLAIVPAALTTGRHRLRELGVAVRRHWPNRFHHELGTTQLLHGFVPSAGRSDKSGSCPHDRADKEHVGRGIEFATKALSDRHGGTFRSNCLVHNLLLCDFKDHEGEQQICMVPTIVQVILNDPAYRLWIKNATA